MPLPESIPVRYTEEEAGYISVRPVVRQTFRLGELTDMVVSVTGKDAARVAQIFRSGTVVYNGYRYWWESLASEPAEVTALLAPFPDDDPSRAFRAEEAVAVLLEIGGGAQHTQVELAREDAAARRFLSRRSAWDCLVEAVRGAAPTYDHYSYSRRGDLFRRSLQYDDSRRLLQEMLAAAPRGLRTQLAGIAPPSAVIFICPRNSRAGG